MIWLQVTEQTDSHLTDTITDLTDSEALSYSQLFSRRLIY